MITEEQFTDWLNSPVTEEILEALERRSEIIKQAWVSQSWDEGQADQLVLQTLKAKAETYKALANINWTTMNEIQNEEKI